MPPAPSLRRTANPPSRWGSAAITGAVPQVQAPSGVAVGCTMPHVAHSNANSVVDIESPPDSLPAGLLVHADEAAAITDSTNQRSWLVRDSAVRSLPAMTIAAMARSRGAIAATT